MKKFRNHTRSIPGKRVATATPPKPTGFIRYSVTMCVWGSAKDKKGRIVKIMTHPTVSGVMKDCKDKLAYVFRQHPEVLSAVGVLDQYYDDILA